MMMGPINRSSLLVSTKWVKNIVKMAPKHHRIIDASWHLPNTGRNAEAEFKVKHIPGAQFFDIDACTSVSPYPHMLPKPNDFESYVGKLGINNDTRVILYDNNPQFPLFSAQRVWWTFRVFGHENVSILEGGLKKWVSEGGETTSEVIKVPDEKFVAKFDSSLVMKYDDISSNIDKPSFTLVDARPEGRFRGIAPEPRDDVQPGNIPGSLNIPFMSMLNLEDGTVKSTEELQVIFKAAGVDLTKPLVVSCGSGISACILALSAYICGKRDVAVYDGSWTEWYLKAPGDKKRDVPSN